MKRFLALSAAALALGACVTDTRYEKAVAAYEPAYCYQSLGAVTCHDEPNFRDERRMVNFYGPSPRHYDRPSPEPEFRRVPIRPFPEGYGQTPKETPQKATTARSDEQPAPPAQPVPAVETE
jgi:hypothetical protein